MTDNIVAMPIGHLSLSRISYHCNLQRADGLVIPIGAIAEMTLGSIRVLGLIARTNLDGNELEHVGQLLRDQMSNPFAFLSKEFDWAWDNTAPGKALSALADRHSESLFISPPDLETVRMALAASGEVSAAELARDEMTYARNAEFLRLLLDTWQDLRVVPNRDTAALAA